MRLAKIVRMPNAEEITNRSSKLRVEISPEEYVSNYNLVEDAKALGKYVKNVKKMMRSSYEYRQLMKFLKEQCGMGQCGNHPNIKMEDDFPIEIHHYPLTITDIIYTLVYKRVERNESLKMTEVLDEIGKLHYMELIGLYPYCTTCHQWGHSIENDDYIPLEALYGSPETFFELYGDFMSEELQNKMKIYLKADEAYTIIDGLNISGDLAKNWLYLEDPDGERSTHMKLSKIKEYVDKIYADYQ